MLIYLLIVIVCILSFISALAVFAAMVVSGRNERIENDESNVSEPFLAWNLRDKKFDEAALKRLADNV